MMLGLRSLLNKPKFEDESPLAVFYYCDHAVNQQMRALTAFMHHTPDNLGRRMVLIRHLKEAQHSLLNVIMSIVHDAIPDRVIPRDFHGKYPDDVVLDMISGPIWFGAECIAVGSHVANREAESAVLRPYAVQLCECMVKVRQALREHCFAKRTTYPQKLKDTLEWFDGVWADFEFRYVSLMTTVKTAWQYYQQQDVVVMFCESTLRALRKKYLTHEMIETMDPVAMFAIPRLAIVCGLAVYPDGPLSTSKLPREMPPFFRAYKPLLARIKELLDHLTEQQFTKLERALCAAEGLGTLDRSPFRTNQPSRDQTITSTPATSLPSRPLSDPVASTTLFTRAEVTTTAEEPNQLATHAHSIRTHQRSRSFDLDSRNSNRTIFEPEPVPGLGSHTNAPETTQNHDEQEVQFPSLGVEYPVLTNLPSASIGPHVNGTIEGETAQATAHGTGDGDQGTNTNDEPSSYAAVDTTEVVKQECFVRHHNNPSTARKIRRRGPGGFASVEDLMHRLFVAISGVADQLQTNYAKDLRVILKHVFTVCQSDPEPLTTSSEDVKYSGALAHSPLTASEGFTFTAATGLSLDDDCPQWVADSDSPSCSSCQERFSWRKRRHHCRSCGQVVCSKCSPYCLPLPKFGFQKAVRVCTNCYIQRLGLVARRASQRFTQSLQVYQQNLH